MDKKINIVEPSEQDLNVPESPKPLAFTIEFGGGKTIDEQRHKALVEKFQNRHKRGQSLSKLDDLPISSTSKRHPSTGNLPRKSNFQTEGGYFSSDEKSEKSVPKNVRSAASTIRLKSNFTLPLKNVISDKMTQSYPNGCFNLSTIRSPDDVESNDMSSPDLILDSSFSPKKLTPSPVVTVNNKKFLCQFSSPSVESEKSVDKVGEIESEFDKADNVSDAGTYTVETDNYTEEQKARMSIDKEFNIEQVSVMKKTEEYIESLNKKERPTKNVITRSNSAGQSRTKETCSTKTQKQSTILPKSPNIPQSSFPNKQKIVEDPRPKLLSPILSPTQNLSIIDVTTKPINVEEKSKPENKILYPSPKAKTGINLVQSLDQGSFTSVTSSGAFSKKNEGKKGGHSRQPSLTKSEIQILTYVDVGCDDKEEPKVETQAVEPNLSAEKIINLPPAVGGISGIISPTKIPSPVHALLTRPRSRNSISSLNIDLSDSSLETESFLKPTQNYINSLQKRLSLDSDPDSDYDSKYNNLRLNNETQKSLHIRHNSFDDRSLKISNKLEHFQNKNLQGIDQTYTNKFNQYSHSKITHKIQNSPNNSPIRRSSSFSNKNHFINVEPKVSNLNTSRIPKDNNLRNSPNLTRNGSIQRSSSTANIKPNVMQLRRSSVNSEHSKIDRSQFADTESSSEDDFEKNLLKKKDFSNLTNTRYNRAFSLRRARLDCEQPQPKCPNTPEMRRKFQPTDHLRSERAISVDRRPIKNEVPSRYLQISRAKNQNPPEKIEITKNVPKTNSNVVKSTKSLPGKPQVFSRTDSGRFSVRTTKPPNQNTQKGGRKDASGKKQSSGRSNSSLSSREVEFQNWKRRKSYDPMKAAAEGKKKAELAKKQNLMSQSYLIHNQDCDSSPSHSSSVHRSQSFHGTAALEQLISSEEEEDELTLSADEGFSPPTPSPCELSPARTAWRNRLLQ